MFLLTLTKVNVISEKIMKWVFNIIFQKSAYQNDRQLAGKPGLFLFQNVFTFYNFLVVFLG